MDEFCWSCTMPLIDRTRRGEGNFCLHCTDEEGRLLPREAIQKGIAGWMRTWQGDIDEETAMARAALFMRAMPAWADG